MKGSSTPSSPRVSLFWTTAGVFAGLILLSLLVYTSGASVSGLIQVVSGLPIWLWVAVAALHVTIVVLAAAKWCMVLAETRDGAGIPLSAATSATATGALLGQVISIQVSVPIVRAWVARRFNISARAAAGTSLFEQSLELLTLGVAAIASVMLVASGGQVWIAVTVVLALLVIATQAIKPLLSFLAGTLGKLPLPGRLHALANALAESFALAATQRTVVIRRLMGLSLLRYMLLSAQSVIVLIAIVPQVGAVPLIVAFPVILLVMSLPFLPAGLGVAEVTWASTLILQGVDPATAAEAAFALRIVSLASYLAVYPFLALVGRSNQRNHSA